MMEEQLRPIHSASPRPLESTATITCYFSSAFLSGFARGFQAAPLSAPPNPQVRTAYARGGRPV